MIILTMKMVLKGNMHLMPGVLYTGLGVLSSLSDWWLLLGAYAHRLKQDQIRKA